MACLNIVSGLSTLSQTCRGTIQGTEGSEFDESWFDVYLTDHLSDVIGEEGVLRKNQPE